MGLQERAAEEESIRASTYAAYADQAAGLYRRLAEGRHWYDEDIDFGDHTLDVGCADGRYIPVIRALGLTVVAAVDPNMGKIGKGIAAEIIDPHHAYIGTIEERVAGGYGPADSAFAFNIAPSIAGAAGFIRALAASVRPGGLVVTSFTHAAHSLSFISHIEREPASGLRILSLSPLSRSTPPPAVSRLNSPNQYLFISRRGL